MGCGEPVVCTPFPVVFVVSVVSVISASPALNPLVCGCQSSGKEKAHKHKQNFPVTARVGGGSPDRAARGLPTGGQGQKFRNPRNINIFVRVPGREDRVPGREDR